MEENNKKNKPLMFIETIQKVDDKSSSQQYFDSRYKKKKEKKE